VPREGGDEVSDEEMLEEARRVLADLEKNGDPFNGTDWAVVQILRRFIGAVPEAGLYRHGYELMGAADISEYLALCSSARRADELEAGTKRLEERDREWWRAARDAMRGHELFPPDYTPEKYPDDHSEMRRDTRALYELYRGRGWADQPACALEMVVNQRDQISARVKELEEAIRRHRDQRGDDRCWMDDEALYAALPEGYTPPPRDSAVELAMCEKFIACRHNPATEYVSPQRRIDELEAERDRLREALRQFKRAWDESTSGFDGLTAKSSDDLEAASELAAELLGGQS
jgi:hypothetical protein